MRKVVLSGMVGNALEWYEYALYAQFAPILSKQFFPKSDFSDQLTFAVFALGFIARPLGAVFFGNIGDKIGRQSALSSGILTMAVPTACIGLLPTYDKIGIIAPIILAIIRVIQGFSLGGAFSGCITYTVEHASIKNRGLVGSISFISMCLGMLLGSTTATILSKLLSQESLFCWGWRIPFIAGLFLGIVGFYIRIHLSESPIYKEAKASGALAKHPFRETIKHNLFELLLSMGLYLTVTAPFFTVTVYIEAFLNKTMQYPLSDAFLINTAGLVVMVLVFPLSAFISDKIGRKPVLIFFSLAIGILVYPIFLLFDTQNFTNALLGHMLFAVVTAGYMGPIPTVLVEMFPTRVRLTGVGLSYNISAAMFGGTAPMVGIMLVQATGNRLAMSFYLSVIAFFTLFLIIKYFKETYHKHLKAS